MGTGADEIFTGHYDHHLLYLAEMHSTNELKYREAQDSWQQKIYPLVRNPLYRDDRLYINKPDYRDHIYEGSIKMQKTSRINPPPIFKEENFSSSLLRNRMLNELFFEVIPVILHEDDRNSMMYSVENRSPFLSYELLHLYREDYLRQIAKQLEFPIDVAHPQLTNILVDDTNSKYFQPIEHHPTDDLARHTSRKWK